MGTRLHKASLNNGKPYLLFMAGPGFEIGWALNPHELMLREPWILIGWERLCQAMGLDDTLPLRVVRGYNGACSFKIDERQAYVDFLINSGIPIIYFPITDEERLELARQSSTGTWKDVFTVPWDVARASGGSLWADSCICPLRYGGGRIKVDNCPMCLFKKFDKKLKTYFLTNHVKSSQIQYEFSRNAYYSKGTGLLSTKTCHDMYPYNQRQGSDVAAVENSEAFAECIELLNHTAQSEIPKLYSQGRIPFSFIPPLANVVPHVKGRELGRELEESFEHILNGNFLYVTTTTHRRYDDVSTHHSISWYQSGCDAILTYFYYPQLGWSIGWYSANDATAIRDWASIVARGMAVDTIKQITPLISGISLNYPFGRYL